MKIPRSYNWYKYILIMCILYEMSLSNFLYIAARKQSEAEDVDPFQRVNTDFDECLIMEVMNRPLLYDFRLNIKERSKFKKVKR